MSERGPYLGQNRALQLEKQIAQLEGRWQERVDRLERELAELRQAQVDTLRSLTGALMQTLRDQLGAAVTTAPTKKRGSG
ncbi:MAG TPA: hypothetical protein VGJ25_09165 [Gaiellaceae bacterium]